jgi:amino acid permease
MVIPASRCTLAQISDSGENVRFTEPSPVLSRKISMTRPPRREVGLIGLTFISLGGIVGSGWLLGASPAAKLAGPAFA